MTIIQGNWTAAITILTTLIAASPHNLVAVNNLCICYLYAGKVHDALRLFESAVDLDLAVRGSRRDAFLLNYTNFLDLVISCG